MKKAKVSWTVRKLSKEIKNGGASFNYPIQRAGGQWDSLQKSLLIHSVACDYPVPPLYALTQEEVVGEGEKAKKAVVYYFLDGKQRSTNIDDYIEGKYRLDNDTPSFKIDGVEYEVAGFSFEELPEEVRNAILEFSLDIYKIEDADDEEIEDMFYRLNNGTPLTQVQKAKAKMGSDTAMLFQNLVKSPVMEVNAVFTPLQIRKADNEVALLQAMMLLDTDYKVGKFGNNEVFDYASSLREGKENVFKEMELTLNYLSETLGDKVEKILLKKLHFPFVVYASHEALKTNVPIQEFAQWLESFKAKIISKENGEKINGLPNSNVWLYKLGCGAGATKAEKVSERWFATKQDIEALIKKSGKFDKEKDNKKPDSNKNKEAITQAKTTENNSQTNSESKPKEKAVEQPQGSESIEKQQVTKEASETK